MRLPVRTRPTPTHEGGMMSGVLEMVAQAFFISIMTLGIYYEAWPLWVSFLGLGIVVWINAVLHVLLREIVLCLGELVRIIGKMDNE